ncbi:MAG: hypothetical protein M4579_006116 [Chaenotheca gracillima]|nr:MAG: hypothetical protein M4579_006116 [Chaenotheca gracillima]
MKAIRQSVRPKHQVLVVKCYPAYQKNAVDVKPNSSELSYLLYYASTRRSKVQKVTDFLETRTVKDVSRGRIWNVQVTLQILKALVEKSPRDLPLYAPCFLRIMSTVLQSRDLTMAEESVSTFETFCNHHEGSSLAADQDYLKQYENVVKTYCNFAKNPTVQSKGSMNAPVALRWRKVGLLAVKAITSSEALTYDAGMLLEMVVPAILQNVYSRDESSLLVLQQRAHHQDHSDGERATKRRLSNATVKTSETSDANPAVVSGTTADADKLAEEDIGLLALQSLKQIFVANSRGQVRIATAVVLGFTVDKAKPGSTDLSTRDRSSGNGDWATTLLEMIARWTPVQDRYVILVTAMETLLRSPMVEANLKQQVLLTKIIGWLLRSNVNLIGLSVMDVLLGLVQHILLLLQLGGNDSSAPSRSSQMGVNGSEKASKEAAGQPSPAGSASDAALVEIALTPSESRIDLLSRLRKCVGDLATHIYYSDQIPDMLSALLLRLKPSALVAMTSSAIENPVAAAQAISRSANLQERPNVDDFFTFETARITALRAIKDVLATANRRDAAVGVSVVGRNKVGVQVWEGTQWLLRDHNGRVRVAYVDALLTWLKFEVGNYDFRELDDSCHSSKSALYDMDSLSGAAMSRRAVSSASNRDRSKPSRSTFLQLLHLAIYDNAIQFAESEPDVLLLHLLLTSLVKKLGINAIKSGLPMVFRLQEEIQTVDGPLAKVHLGSLVHGYFWAVSDKFDFETSSVGGQIQSEISRRKEKGMWLNKINLPPLSSDQISSSEITPASASLPAKTVEGEALKPYDGRNEIIDCVANAYSSSFSRSSANPPSSPSRVVSMPILGSAVGPELPTKVREQMLSTWSKEAVIFSCEKTASKTASLNGSRTGTNRSLGKAFLEANGANGQPSRSRSRTPQNRQSRPPSTSAYGLVGGGLSALQKVRNSSALDRSPTPISSSSRSSTVRVDDLKRVLSGSGEAERNASTPEGMHSGSSDQSVSSEDISASDRSESDDNVEPSGGEVDSSNGAKPSLRLPSSPSGDRTEEQKDDIEEEDADSVPPVPPIPASLSLPGGYPGTPPLAEIAPGNAEARRTDRDDYYSPTQQIHPPSSTPAPPSESGVSERPDVDSNGPSHPYAQRNSRSIRRNVKGRSSEVGSWVSFGSGTAGTGPKVDVRELLGGIGTTTSGREGTNTSGGWTRSANDLGDTANRGNGAGVGKPPY